MLRYKVKLKLITGVVGAGLFLMATSASVTAQDQPFGTARKPQTCPDRSAPKKGAKKMAK